MNRELRGMMIIVIESIIRIVSSVLATYNAITMTESPYAIFDLIWIGVMWVHIILYIIGYMYRNPNMNIRKMRTISIMLMIFFSGCEVTLVVLTASLDNIVIIIDSVLKIIITGWGLFKFILTICILVYTSAKRSETQPLIAEIGINESSNREIENI
ncbi:uncharacterized protein OCT59_001759 [Rhizophagus irregularis]|uniref:Uncharacterized protein n=1 Tax=Rhizophagus irregularis (strain DAOM 181602 / DAOM 197198 / MUCL 43194) TaxID=747089 RepID=A0A2P4QSA5_RHIID|nr:hypothetical protein GLOIN_2v1835620 [Rhizophagus irregularis DAOM 181602=DAOM 197198]POG80533.1 hypothetical protein GLOIN_2v1835620 [Rhizophagus irregularis DAOM 181602=DAOM 197198]UZO10161.1 hypothetical protein OCT59_001759 [Rhizophagus irregularis]|eukprot:XP_025187399.1 hypothetical protein GLOIN_2v1835620 [Rhizophagus irregularis DAOM 181602=DAOM 197198]